MGHWSIYDVDDGSNPLDETWGDQEADMVGEYLEYLAFYEPRRLLDRESLIEDVTVLVWSVYYELEVGRKATHDEVEYGINFSWESRLNPLSPDGPENQSPLTASEVNQAVEILTEYFEYLQETDGARLEEEDTLLEDARVLTWEVFHSARSRPACQEELQDILAIALSG